MRIVELPLDAQNQTIVGEALIYARATTKRDNVGRKVEYLTVGAQNGKPLYLEGAIDVGENIEAPRIFVVHNNDPALIIILGGVNVFWLDINSSAVLRRCALNRETRDAEYWDFDFFRVDDQLVVIYEGGIFLVNSDLSYCWHKDKFYNEEVERIENGVVYIEGPEEGEGRMVHLKDGSDVS